MLRRPPTIIQLTSEDIAAFDDQRAIDRALAENRNAGLSPGTVGANLAKAENMKTPTKDPNDELKPLPGEKRGLGGRERIMGTGR